MRRYHHLALPTKKKKPGEVYKPNIKAHMVGFYKSDYGIEWMRFDEDAPYPEALKNNPHIAFIVDNLDEEIRGKKVIFGPVETYKGWKVAIVEENEAYIELIESSFTDEQILKLAKGEWIPE